MTWFIYALLAPLVFTVVNFVDKLILEKHIRNPLMMSPFVSLMALLNGTVLWVLTGFPVLSLHDMVIVIFPGLLTAFGAVLYYRALATEETSKVIVLIQMQPVMVLTLAFLLLNETISPMQLVGFVLILGAVLALSVRKGMGGIPRSTFIPLLIVNFLWSLSVVLFKFVAETGDFTRFLAYESWGMALGGLLIYLFFPSVRKAFHENVRQVPRRALGVIALNETIFVVAKLMTLAAVALGPTALVSVLGGTQVFFGIVAGWLLTVVAPTVYKENINRSELVRKGAVALVLFAGIGLININA
ncbi:MAG: EamA family transporter [Chloroflexi bacterium]|nr:EamA family transporter [Chloroflexota bacterium]MCC6895181.1 EamA family transporter [Anaerolineae bacterium]